MPSANRRIKNIFCGLLIQGVKNHNMKFYYLFLPLNIRHENFKAIYSKLGVIGCYSSIVPHYAWQAIWICSPDRDGNFQWGYYKG
jgi:hypothetical protein